MKSASGISRRRRYRHMSFSKAAEYSSRLTPAERKRFWDYQCTRPDVRGRRREARRWIDLLVVLTLNPSLSQQRPGDGWRPLRESMAIWSEACARLREHDPELACAVERLQWESMRRDVAGTRDEWKARLIRARLRLDRLRAEMRQYGAYPLSRDQILPYCDFRLGTLPQQHRNCERRRELRWTRAVRRVTFAVRPRRNIRNRPSSEIQLERCCWRLPCRVQLGPHSHRSDVFGILMFRSSAKIPTCGSGGTADALASGASWSNPVGVQIPPSAPDQERPRFFGPSEGHLKVVGGGLATREVASTVATGERVAARGNSLRFQPNRVVNDLALQGGVNV
jgi:hypothetical protein